jgi:hypothetical protein
MSNNSQIRNKPINFSGSGDNVVISAIAAQQIEVVALYLVVSGTTNLTFKDGNGLLFSGAMAMVANGTIVLDEQNTLFWFSTPANFIINSSGAVQVSGQIFYKQE